MFCKWLSQQLQQHIYRIVWSSSHPRTVLYQFSALESHEIFHFFSVDERRFKEADEHVRLVFLYRWKKNVRKPSFKQVHLFQIYSPAL